MTSDTLPPKATLAFGHPRRGMTDRLVIKVDRDSNESFLESLGPLTIPIGSGKTLHEGGCVVTEETAAKMLGDKK